jgi:hypothetical protein
MKVTNILNIFFNGNQSLNFSEEPETGIDAKCPRANGFFNHESPTVCDKYENH